MQFIKTVLPFFLAMLVFSGCSKSDNNNCSVNMGNPSSAELSDIQSYLTSKGITAQLDTRGFYYRIVNPGTGSGSPTPTSNVTVSYEGTLKGGTVFDGTGTGAPVTFPLNGLILGWQYGIPIVTRGGVIDLYLPPSLAYGCEALPGIPAGSMLIFRVTLVNF